MDRGLIAESLSTFMEAGPPLAPEQRGGRRILLTNDDGWSASGIDAARRALVGAGHDVVVVAPDENQSGSGARIAFSGQLAVTRRDVDVFSVSGSPSEATEFGLSVVLEHEPPDLVVSGINSGQNVGAIVIHSGTVGAVVTALADGVPAIAVSAEVDLGGGATPYPLAAEFLVELVTELDARSGGGPLLPLSLGLNVNVPYVEDGGEPAVVAAPIGRGFIDVTYHGAALPQERNEVSTFMVGFTFDVEERVDGADTTALANDHITITPITPSFTPSA